MTVLVLDCRNDHHRNVRILRAQQQQAGKAAHARHVEVEQHEVAVAIGLERGAEPSRSPASSTRDRGVAAGQRLAQGGAEQRVVVDDDDAAAVMG